jgi:hypothetical protein
MWPMPGVANSTMKCPNFADLVFDMALRSSAIAFPPWSRRALRPCESSSDIVSLVPRQKGETGAERPAPNFRL